MPTLRKPIPDDIQSVFAEYPELLRHLLYHRGVADAGSATEFLNPDYDKHTHDPFLMKGMEEAVERVLSAIRNKEKIVIFSDYDADGVPGGVLLHDFFKKVGHKNFSNYVPHRHDEGFGLNSEAIERFTREGATLMITVDCGIADVAEVAHAKKLGIETIITDHHEPGPEGTPKAFAVLDPKQKGCAYPFKELCGAGVAFKLVQGLMRRATILNPTPFTLPPIGWEKWLLDLVGIATLSDMVPLVGENRVFARYGLLVLRKSPRPGLQKMFRKSGMNQRQLNEEDISFSLTPKLNAASRLGSADVAFRLLSTDDEVEAGDAVDELLHLNNERKGMVGSLVREIKKIVAERYQNPSVIVIGNPLWRPALLGLAANTLAGEHACPVFLWGRDGDGAIKGSCRSDGRVNLMELMQAASGAFVEYGGHAFSGGFTVESEKIHTLEETLRAAREKVEVTDSPGSMGVADWRLSPDEVTRDFYMQISQLAPFGHSNPKPVFLFENLSVKSARRFGKENNHLEIHLPRSNESTIKAIQFFTTAEPPQEGSIISMLASLEQSSFGGRTELRLRIVEIV
ncbi:MAG TPA: single-stranded-DNA-specific exonuclease RecJ [Candidatus Paceibacterota bacterium]